MKRKIKVNRHLPAGNHPVTDEVVTLKWFRGAHRYNNGATKYGRQYVFRYIVGLLKYQINES